MATMGTYCKAYLVKQLRQYSQWRENSSKRKLTDDDIVYLQENYVVTGGIFKDDNIIFDDVAPEWQEFCQQSLKFEVPIFETVG
jgi:hypothetical protein